MVLVQTTQLPLGGGTVWPWDVAIGLRRLLYAIRGVGVVAEWQFAGWALRTIYVEFVCEVRVFEKVVEGELVWIC